MLFKLNCIDCLSCRVFLIVIKRTKLYKQCCSNKTVFIVCFGGLYNRFAEFKRTEINSVVQTKLYSLFDMQGLFNSFDEIKRTKLQGASKKSWISKLLTFHVILLFHKIQFIAVILSIMDFVSSKMFPTY